MAKRYLITGGSGFIGGHFHEAMTNEQIVNYDILPPTEPCNSTYVEGDIQDTALLSKSLKGIDTVIHLAATHFDFQQNYFKTNVEGTQSLIKACEENDIKCIVFYSSVAVYGAISKPTDENENPSPNMPYGQSKYEAEKELMTWAEKDAERILILIRPTVVFGRNNFGNVFNLIKQIDSGLYFHIGDGQNVKSITYVKNLVNNTLELLDQAKPGCHIYNNIDEPQLNTRDLSNLIARLLKKPIKLTLPKPIVNIMVLPFELLKVIFKVNTPISRARIKKFTISTHFVPANLKKAGIEPICSSEEALKDTIEWYKSVDWKVLYEHWRERVEKYA